MSLFFPRHFHAAAFSLLMLALMPLPGGAQSKTTLRISSPAVSQDWHAKMWTVFKDKLQATAPGEFDVQI